MQLPVMPPVAPMLAKSVAEIPDVGHIEPKWDGFRTIVFRDGDEVELGSRNERPMTRYFPEVVEAVKANLPQRCVVDGEIVVIRGDRLDFESLQQRIHPAASRVNLLARETPASFIAFDLLAVDDESLMDVPFGTRRPVWWALADAEPPVHLTPATADLTTGVSWLDAFEGAAWTAWSPSRWTARTSPTSGPCSRSSTSAQRTVSWPGSAGTRAAVSSDRCCSGSTTTTVRSSMSESGVVPDGAAGRARDRAGAVPDGRRQRSPVGGLGGGRGAGWWPAARCGVAVERQEGPVLGGASPRARGRGRLRPHGGHAVPAHGSVPRWRPDRDPRSCTYEQLDQPSASTWPRFSRPAEPEPGTRSGTFRYRSAVVRMGANCRDGGVCPVYDIVVLVEQAVTDWDARQITALHHDPPEAGAPPRAHAGRRRRVAGRGHHRLAGGK